MGSSIGLAVLGCGAEWVDARRSRVPSNEFLRCNRLGLVAAAIQNVEMSIMGDDEFRLGGNGAVGEFVVIRSAAMRWKR